MLNDKSLKEIVSVDPDGNVWRIAMWKMGTKTNRYQLSFFFNDKEFVLSRLQSNRSALDLWELLEKTRKAKALVAEIVEEEIEPVEKKQPAKEKKRPTKRVKS